MKTIKIIITLLIISIHSSYSQNIAIERKKGIYKVINLNIEDDSLNFIPVGKFKPTILSESTVELYRQHCVPELSTACLFTVKKLLIDNDIEIISSKGISVRAQGDYYFHVKRRLGRWVFIFKNEGETYKVREKYRDNQDNFFETVCKRFKSFKVKGLECSTF